MIVGPWNNKLMVVRLMEEEECSIYWIMQSMISLPQLFTSTIAKLVTCAFCFRAR